MKERVVFEANVPVTATLAYPDGLKVQGPFGDQVMYSLTDGRVMYVPPVVRDKFVELASGSTSRLLSVAPSVAKAIGGSWTGLCSQEVRQPTPRARLRTQKRPARQLAATISLRYQRVVSPDLRRRVFTSCHRKLLCTRFSLIPPGTKKSFTVTSYAHITAIAQAATASGAAGFERQWSGIPAVSRLCILSTGNW